LSYPLAWAGTTKDVVDEQRHRFDFFPWLLLSETVQLGPFVALPLSRMPAAAFATRRIEQRTRSLIRIYRNGDGSCVDDATVLLKSDLTLLSAHATPREAAGLQRAADILRYAILIANRPRWNFVTSTHLELAGYTFTAKSRAMVTFESRYMRLLALERPQVRPPIQIHQAMFDATHLDPDLLTALTGQLTKPDSRGRRRLWRSLWWFNRAHHDDPFQPWEFSMTALAIAYEALVRPQPKSDGLKRAVAKAVGTHDFDAWVEDFYAMRSGIVHGDVAWDPMYGQYKHVSHYRIATDLYPLMVNRHLHQIGAASAPLGDLARAIAIGPLSRMLHSNREIIERLTAFDFQALKLKRNALAAYELRVLPVLLTDEDQSTPAAEYLRLTDWLRRLAVSACLSGAARWPVDRAVFHTLRREFAGGTPRLRSVVSVPAGADLEAALLAKQREPAMRALVGNATLTNVAEAMADADERRTRAAIRERQQRR
jgi:hypothetical protein